MRVHSFESLAAVDGEGLRYGVFLSGCPLRCPYCHNPDTWDAAGGRDYSPQELFHKLCRYLPYFSAGGGGVTFSGGEPLLQAEEIAALGKLLKTKQIGYALDTSGHVPLTEAVKQAVKGAELILCDLKFPDETSFSQYCKGELQRVFSFLDFLRQEKKRLWLRTVIVPGLNDSPEMIARYSEAARPYQEIAERYELLPFHTLGFFKYRDLGLSNPLQDCPPMDKEKLQKLQELLTRSFFA